MPPYRKSTMNSPLIATSNSTASIDADELSPAVALILHRWHIQGIVADVVKASGPMSAGIERLCSGLEAYWESAFARRSMHHMVEQLAHNHKLLHRADSMGKPFCLLIELELKVSGWVMPSKKARVIFDEARAIMLEEIETGRRSSRREDLLSMIPQIVSDEGITSVPQQHQRTTIRA